MQHRSQEVFSLFYLYRSDVFFVLDAHLNADAHTYKRTNCCSSSSTCRTIRPLTHADNALRVMRLYLLLPRVG